MSLREIDDYSYVAIQKSPYVLGSDQVWENINDMHMHLFCYYWNRIGTGLYINSGCMGGRNERTLDQIVYSGYIVSVNKKIFFEVVEERCINALEYVCSKDEDVMRLQYFINSFSFQDQGAFFGIYTELHSLTCLNLKNFEYTLMHDTKDFALTKVLLRSGFIDYYNNEIWPSIVDDDNLRFSFYSIGGLGQILTCAFSRYETTQQAAMFKILLDAGIYLSSKDRSNCIARFSDEDLWNPKIIQKLVIKDEFNDTDDILPATLPGYNIDPLEPVE